MLKILKETLIKNWYSRKNFFILSIILKSINIFYKIYLFIKKINYFKYTSPIYIIIIGNITTGGSGKTPTVIYFSILLKKIGLKITIISNGYKNKTKNIISTNTHNKKYLNDESLLLLKKSKNQVISGKNRKLSIKYTLNTNNIDLALFDDGLQYYKIKKNLSVCILDNKKKLGNKNYIPLGPLREKNIYTINLVCNDNINRKNKFKIKYIVNTFINTKKKVNLDFFKKKQVYTITGIGHPDKFFKILINNNIKIYKKYIFSNHYEYKKKDFIVKNLLPILITEKDFIKCIKFKNKFIWSSKLKICISLSLINYIFKLIKSI